MYKMGDQLTLVGLESVMPLSQPCHSGGMVEGSWKLKLSDLAYTTHLSRPTWVSSFWKYLLPN